MVINPLNTDTLSKMGRRKKFNKNIIKIKRKKENKGF